MRFRGWVALLVGFLVLLGFFQYSEQRKMLLQSSRAVDSRLVAVLDLAGMELMFSI